MAAKKGRQEYRGGERRSWPAWVWLALGTAFGVILSVVALSTLTACEGFFVSENAIDHVSL